MKTTPVERSELRRRHDIACEVQAHASPAHLSGAPDHPGAHGPRHGAGAVMTVTAYLALIAGLLVVIALSGASFVAGVPALLFLVGIRRGYPRHIGGAR